MKAVGPSYLQVTGIKRSSMELAVTQSLLLSTASCGWEQKHKPTLGPTLHGDRSLCPSSEMPWVGTALENEPELGGKAATSDVRLLPFLMPTCRTNRLHRASPSSSNITTYGWEICFLALTRVYDDSMKFFSSTPHLTAARWQGGGQRPK